jgi:hypothetical protein
VRERRHGQPLPFGQLEPAGPNRLQQRRVAGRVDHHRHAGVVLRRSTHHGRAADIDLLDRVVAGRAGRHGLPERVQVAHHQVERGDAEPVELGQVRRPAGVREQPGVHRGVQRLDPAVEALREPGQLLDLGHRHPGRPQHARGGAGGHDLHAGRGQPGTELGQTRLVVHADQCPADRPPGVPRMRRGTGMRHGISTLRPSMW